MLTLLDNGKVNDFRDRCNHRDIIDESPNESGLSGTRIPVHHTYDGRTVVHGPVLFELVISSLKEGCHYRINNLGTASRGASHCGNTGLFGNCNVNVLVASGLSFSMKPKTSGVAEEMINSSGFSLTLRSK